MAQYYTRQRIWTRKILEGPARRDVLTDEELDVLGFSEDPEEPVAEAAEAPVPAVALAPRGRACSGVFGA